MKTNYTIGHAPDNDIILKEGNASSLQATCYYDKGKWFIENQHNSIPLYINEVQITEKYVLQKKDIIRIGNQTLHWANYLIEGDDQDLYLSDLYSINGRISRANYRVLSLLIIGMSCILRIIKTKTTIIEDHIHSISVTSMLTAIAYFLRMKNLLILGFLFIIIGCTEHSTQKQTSTKSTQSWAFDAFVKVDSLNPIMHPTANLKFDCPLTNKPVNWEERNVLNPSAVVKGDTVYLFYRAQDLRGTSRIGLAKSTDGLRFQKSATPVFYPDNDIMKTYEWNYRKLNGNPVDEDCKTCYFDGVEDPRIIESADGRYIMTYTAYDGKTARLSIASSTNLTSWTKHGLVFKSEKYKDRWSKSGAIVVESIGSKQIAKKINGKYWMYFGDTNLFLASSDDLINWEISENAENNKMISVLHPRMGYFDSRLVEPGPYALYKEEGILVIYNGSNAANFNDPNLSKFTYAAGQALFDRSAPHKLIDRTKDYFIYPDKDYEKIGEVNEVCFVEGLVHFKEQWFLYYGTADSKIAVAIND